MSNRHHQKKISLPPIGDQKGLPSEESRKIQLEIDMIRFRMRQVQVRMDHGDIAPLSFFIEMGKLKLAIINIERKVNKLSKELEWEKKN